MTQPYQPEDSDSLLQFSNLTLHSRAEFSNYKDATFLQSGIVGNFMEFLLSAFDAMGISGALEPRDIVHSILSDKLSNPDIFCREIWNRQAMQWSMTESPANYGITIDTYVKYIRFDPTKKRETIVSLGAGPGLYEAFMGMLFSASILNQGIKIYCIDYAQKMTAWNKEMLKRMRISDIHPVTGNMMALEFPDQSVDQVICNNALQWVSDWKKALFEMVRIIRHDGRRRIYLVINLHPMVVRDTDENIILTLGDFTLEQILDELEALRCDINNIRHMAGRKGVGQHGGIVNRVFIEAEFQIEGCKRRWKDFKGTPEVRGISLS